MVQWVKDLVLSWQQPGFDPWPSDFSLPQAQPKNSQQNKTKSLLGRQLPPGSGQGCLPSAPLLGPVSHYVAHSHLRMEYKSSCCGSAETNLTSIHEKVGSIPGLVQWVKGSSVAVSCGIGRRHGCDPMLLWP